MKWIVIGLSTAVLALGAFALTALGNGRDTPDALTSAKAASVAVPTPARTARSDRRSSAAPARDRSLARRCNGDENDNGDPTGDDGQNNRKGRACQSDNAGDNHAGDGRDSGDQAGDNQAGDGRDSGDQADDNQAGDGRGGGD
jgi:hypothetical protein